MTKYNSLSIRMKEYENIPKSFLTKRMPLIIRIDGKSFHSFTKNCIKPWDKSLVDSFVETSIVLLREISGAKLIYTQSDEISILCTDYDTLTTQPWFGKNIQKIASVSASITTAIFNQSVRPWSWAKKLNNAYFDSRCFVLPKEEVCNYFLWRQQDCTRNSISGLAQHHFSHKQLHRKNSAEMQDMLFKQKNINWNDCEVWQKRGVCVYKNEEGKVVKDFSIPIFSQDRNFIDRFVFVEDNSMEKVHAAV